MLGPEQPPAPAGEGRIRPPPARQSTSQPGRMSPEQTSMMPFGDHLEELRKRLIWALVGLAPIMVVALWFGKTVIAFLIRPVERQLIRAGQAPVLQALSPIEPFSAYIKVAMALTVLIGAPWVLWQLWLFIAPGLYAHERRFARFLVPLSVTLTAAAAVFLYKVMLPLMLFFLISFGADLAQVRTVAPAAPYDGPLASIPVLAADPEQAPPGSAWVLEPSRQLRIRLADGQTLSAPLTTGGIIAQQYRIREYLDLFITLALVFAIAFQTPVVVMLLSWAGIVDVRWLARRRRHVFFLCAILSAVLTPTGDPASMALLLAPLYLLFELGLALARFVPARRVAQGLAPGATDGDEDDDDGIRP